MTGSPYRRPADGPIPRPGLLARLRRWIGSRLIRGPRPLSPTRWRCDAALAGKPCPICEARARREAERAATL